MLSIDEYRFLSGYESNGKDILNAIHMAIRRLTNKRILPLHINDSSYLFLSESDPKNAAAQFMKQEGEAARWTTICLYENRQSLEHLPVLCGEMDRYRRWYVKLYGSGHIIAAGRRRTLIFRQKENRRIMKCCFPSSRMEKRKR